MRRAPARRVAGALALYLVAGCADGGTAELAVPENPTYASHVAEIVQSRCASCHHPDGVGPFSLTTYEEVAPRAEALARAVGEGRMPPWLPEPGDYPFADELRVTSREAAILERWAANGAPLGDAAAVPTPVAATTGWSLGEPDVVLEMPEAYTLARSAHTEGGHHDIFRNFILPVPIGERKWVRAIEFQSNVGGVVHHATMGVDATSASRHEDARDPEPGFEGLHSSSRVRQPAGFVLGWTPGATPRWNPDGLAWPLDPGTDFVVQAHLMPAAQPVDLRVKVGLYFGEPPAARSALVKNLYLLGRRIDIPAGASEYVVEDRFTLPTEVEVLGLYPHAHYLARSVEVTATLPGGRVRTLLSIPRWDFDWQQVYQFAAPVELPAGTELRMRWVYDNSAANPRNPHDPPRRVTYGLTSEHEMAEVWIQARPQDPAALAALQAAVDGKRTADYLELFGHLAQVDPGNALALSDLAAVLASTGRTDEAIARYRAALELDPGLADVHYELGLLLDAGGRGAEAADHLEEAVRLFPQHAGAHVALGRVHLRAGRGGEAADHARRAAAIDPRDPAPHLLLGAMARAAGDLGGAVEHLRDAVQAAPANPGLHYDLASAMILTGSGAEAVEHLRAGRALDPGNLSPALAAGWMLAGHPDPAIRRPDSAAEVARDLEDALGAGHPIALDLLAAAHASAGRFDQAINTARQAVSAARGPDQAALVRSIRSRLALYEAGRAYLSAAGPYAE